MKNGLYVIVRRLEPCKAKQAAAVGETLPRCLDYLRHLCNKWDLAASKALSCSSRLLASQETSEQDSRSPGTKYCIAFTSAYRMQASIVGLSTGCTPVLSNVVRSTTTESYSTVSASSDNESFQTFRDLKLHNRRSWPAMRKVGLEVEVLPTHAGGRQIEWFSSVGVSA